MESRVDDLKLAGAPAAVVGEAGTLVEHQLVMALPFSESFSETPAQVVEQVAPVVGQGTDKRRKRRRQTKSLAPKLHPAKKMMKEAPKLHPAKKMMKEEEEEVCFICFDGGSLVLCDRKGCPKAYHPACIKRDEAFFQSKAKWDCGWHFCSVCEKAAHYMCYTCTYALCKRCSKNADYVCVRENKGFCTICMKTIMMLENKDAGSKELIQVDFDDKTSWEYLFKIYWNLLKGKLSLNVDELIQAKNPHVGVIGIDFKEQTPGKDKSTEGVAVPILPKSSEHSEQNPCRGVIGTDIKQQIPEKDNSTEGVAVPTLQDQHQLPDQSSFSTEKPSSDKRKISDLCTDWGSKELLEFVSHMKNGDTSVLSQSDVQALLMEYIKKNNLRDPRLKSQIICDLRLKLLFGKPRVGHIEMLKLLEHHYLLKEDTPKNAFIDGCTSHVGDDQNDDSVSNPSKRQKTRKKGEERAPQVNLNEYAAIDPHNINLIFLRRSAIVNLIDEEEKFHEKVVGSVVRIRVSCNDQGQDLYRLVRVVGTSKGAEPYKLGYKTTDVMIEVLNLDKKETLSIDAVSNQVFTEDECRHLHQNIKCGIVKPLTVGDIQMKAVALQALRFDDWLIAEILRLSHLRDKANENGRKKEHRECVEKLKLLRTPEVRHQKLTEIPEVHIDPKMNPNHQSEDDTSKNDEQKGEVSKLGITGDHTLQPRKCVKENEATSAQALQQKRDDGDGSNSSPNHRLRPRKSVKENKTTSAQRVQPKRGRGGSNSFPKQENHVSPGGSSSVGNQSVLRPDSETATVAPVSTIRAQRKRGGGGSSSFPKQENDVSPGGSSSVVGNQSVRPDSETATVAPVSSIQVQQKRDGGGSNSFLKQENHVSPGGGGSTSVIGNQSVLRPDSETAKVAPVSTIRVQPKRHGDTSKSIPKQENHVSPGGSSSVLGNQSERRPDSETATVAPVSTIRVQPKRDGGRSNSIPKQENHVSPDVSSSVLGNQSVPRPDSETASVAPVSTIRVQQKRGSGRSKSLPKQENQVSPGCSSSVVGNQSVLRPDPVTAKVAPVSRIRAQQKKGGGGSKSSPKQENHVSPPGSSSVVGSQSVEMPDLETATVAAVSRIQVQQKRDGGDSNSSPKQENHVSPGGSSIVIGNQSVLKPDSETATVAPVSGIQGQQKKAGGGSNSSPQQDNHVSPGGGPSSVIGNQSVRKPDSETATVAPVSGTQVPQKRDGGGSNSSPQQDNHENPGGGSSSVIGNQSVLRPDSEAATVSPASGTSLPTSDTQMEKLWHYRDPNGKIQGPFSMLQLQKWSTTGYFPLDMRIWTDNEQDHSVLLTDALAGDFCSDTRSNAAREGLDSHTSDCSAHALVKEKQQPEVVQCSDLLKNVPASSERPVVHNNNLEAYAVPLNQVTKHGVEELNDAGVNEHPDEAPLHDSSGMESEVAGVNDHPNEAPMHHSPSIESKNAGGVNVHPIEAPLQYSPSVESKDTGINEHPDEASLHRSPDIERKDAGVNKHPIEAPLHHSPSIECEDADVNEHPNEASLQHSTSIESDDASVNEHPKEAPMHRSPSIESENAGVNEHPNEAPLLHSPGGIESKEMSSMNQNYVSSGQIRPPVLLDLDLNNKDCNPALSLSNPNESPENKADLDLVNLPSPTPKIGNRNSESQLNEQDSMSIDIQAAELLRSLSGYVPVNGMRVSDVQTPANNEMDEDLPIPTPKPSDSDDGDLRNPEQKPSDENQFGQSDENRLGESDDGPCKILMKDLGWSNNASSQVVGGGAQMQETTAGVWISSPARDEPSCKEWDFGLVPMSSLQHSDAVGGGDQAATTTPNGNRHLLLDLSSWPAGINEPIEFNTLAEESVSDLLAEVDAMESKSGLPSPSSAMRSCGDDLIDRNDCFSSIEELSPTPDAGKSDAVSSNPGIPFPSQPTEFHDHDPIGVASQVSAFDPLKRPTAHSTTSSGAAETKSVGYPINFWEPGSDIHPPAPGTTLNQQPIMVNAPPNHVWGAVQGNMNMGWAGPPPLPPPPQAFANMGWRPIIGTTTAPPWVDSNLSLGAYNGNGGWDNNNNPHRFSGSRDYNAVQSGDMGFGRGGRPVWNRQQHGGGGGGGGGGHSRPSPKGQRVCKFYESGHCKKGSACGYLHP